MDPAGAWPKPEGHAKSEHLTKLSKEKPACEELDVVFGIDVGVCYTYAPAFSSIQGAERFQNIKSAYAIREAKESRLYNNQS